MRRVQRTFGFLAFFLSALATFTFSASSVLAGPSAGQEQKAPEFRKEKLRVGDKIITVEVADTDQLRERGLMHRESLPPDQGMLFVFESERPLRFWMKNTYIPLSIGFFDKNQKLIEVLEMAPPVLGEINLKTYASKSPAQYALEMNKNWFKKNEIQPGTKFSFISKPR